MNRFWLNLAYSCAAFLLQYYVLPQFSLGAYVPELLLASITVSSIFYGLRWAMPFAILSGLAVELNFGYGYGMYLLPLVLCAFFGQYLSSMSFERPWTAAAIVGAGAFLARVFRSLLAAGSGHGAFMGMTDLVPALVCALLTAVCALLMIFDQDRRQRRGKSGRYDL